MSRVSRPANRHGALLIDKPQGITSHDVVSRVRKIAGQKQVGHCGTLDPMATGLMIILLGMATKLEPYLTKLDKSYSGAVELGRRTNTDDVTGETISLYQGEWPPLTAISKVLQAMEGPVMQVPPAYSAIKVCGVKAYAAARQGRSLDLKARPVIAYNIKITGYQPPTLCFLAEVSSGYYIRALARDLGLTLNLGGAALAALRRETVGPWQVKNAVSLEKLTYFTDQDWHKNLLLPAELLPHQPTIVLDDVAKQDFCQGRFIASSRLSGLNEVFDNTYKVLDKSGALLGLAKFTTSVGGQQPLEPFLRPLRVLLTRGL